MDMNNIIFPVPGDDRIDKIIKHKGELIFIPKLSKNDSYKHIPCLLKFSNNEKETNKYLFYFHGNAEDIFFSNICVELLRTTIAV